MTSACCVCLIIFKLSSIAPSVHIHRFLNMEHGLNPPFSSQTTTFKRITYRKVCTYSEIDIVEKKFTSLRLLYLIFSTNQWTWFAFSKPSITLTFPVQLRLLIVPLNVHIGLSIILSIQVLYSRPLDYSTLSIFSPLFLVHFATYLCENTGLHNRDQI